MSDNYLNQSSPSADLLWQQPEVIRWSQILAESYYQLLGRELVVARDTPERLAESLFKAPFVVVSHGTEPDPILNYGNQAALNLWSMSWSEFTQTPSRLTAEPVNRASRASILEQVATRGYIDNYQGIRISSTGKRFAIAQTVIWNLTDAEQPCGQAATFAHWKWL